MGTTARLNLRYPEPTGRVRVGQAAIRALAEDVTNAVDWIGTAAHIGPADSGSVADGSAVDFPGGQPLMAGFTYAGGSLTYTGPRTRMFLACVSVEVEAGGAAATSISSTVVLNVNGTGIEGSHDFVAASSPVLTTRRVVHTITNLLLLAPGQVVTVTASSGSTVRNVGQCSIKLQPIGPMAVS